MASHDYWAKLQGAYRRRAAKLVFKRNFVIDSRRPLISFTFDDFPRSAWLEAGPVLHKFGLNATYYVSMGLAGQHSPGGPIFEIDDLYDLVQHGHELGCHTFSHCDSWETDGKKFEASVVENRQALQNLFPEATFENFSYPISLPRVMSKARVSRHFLSCRGGEQSYNVGTVDLNQLSAFFLEKSRDDIQAVKDLIDTNRKRGGWLIFATHDVTRNPSPFGCTPEFFEEIVRYSVDSGAEVLPVVRALEVLHAPGTQKARTVPRPVSSTVRRARSATPAKPLVSILIPAYNAQEWIADTLRSAISQTWQRKEIIVVDDGSADQTMAVAGKFEAQGVRVVSQKNAGGAAARNTAFSLCQGDYIQWLDADDLLAPDKISRQMALLEQPNVTSRTLLSSEYGRFLHRWQRAQFVSTALWEDLTPVEWLLRKLDHNLWMQTATWLVSRELSEVSGPWDTRMLSDDDGEYFCRVLLKSDGTRFAPSAKMYYRGFRFDSLAHVGKSDRKRDALWLSMQLHINYLRSLEDSQRTRIAAINYLQRNLIHFYPERTDIIEQAEHLARDLGTQLQPPNLSSKYQWIKSTFGWTAAKDTALRLRKLRWSVAKSVDRMMFHVKSEEQKGDDIHSDTKLDLAVGKKRK